MQCPQCTSENTQRLRVVFEGGTQSIQTTSATGGLGFGRGFASGGGVTTTSGVAQSGLAATAAPPTKARYWPPIALTIVGLFLSDLRRPYNVVGLAVCGLGLYRLWQTRQHNGTVWPALFAQWNASWMCHRCGHMYVMS